MNLLLKSGLIILTLCIAATCAVAQDMPLHSLPVKTVNGKAYHYYIVQPKETIYSLTHKLGIDKSTIERYNPAVKDGLRVHETLYFPAEGIAPESTTTEQAKTQSKTDSKSAKLASRLTHKAKKGESAYAIAHQYGVSVDDLVSANPQIANGVKANDLIAIPEYFEDGIQEPVTAAVQPEASSEEEITAVDTYANEPETPKGINIAVMLPFQSETSKPAKQAIYYTDFLKGILMAIDTLKTEDRAINLKVYDTGDRYDTVKALLAHPDMTGTDVIIAPEDSAQIEIIAQWADTASAKVINMFAVHNTAHTHHPSVIQGNIPHELMYERAVDEFIKHFDGYTPIILTNTAEGSDKSKFTNMLISRLTANSAEFKKIAFREELNEQALDWMTPEQRYVFVPESGTRVMLNCILPAILAKKDSALDSDNVRLFGYPEWIIIRGDLQQKLHEAGTTIYSRFTMNTDNYRYRNLENRFKQWYGSAMIATAPVYGILGFDTGSWIIKSMNHDWSANHTGLQNGFAISQPEQQGQGHVNTALFFINFQPNGTIETTEL